MVRAPGCNWNNETTVLAHMNGAGMAMKSDDVFGAWCCSACHDLIDFRMTSVYSKEQIAVWHYEGIIRTQRELLKLGALLIKGEASESV